MSEVTQITRKIATQIPEKGDIIAITGSNAKIHSFQLAKVKIKNVENIDKNSVLFKVSFDICVEDMTFNCFSIYSKTDYFRSQIRRNIEFDLTYDWKVFMIDVTFQDPDLEEES